MVWLGEEICVKKHGQLKEDHGNNIEPARVTHSPNASPSSLTLDGISSNGKSG
jgi:hypothetical protein